MEMEIETWTGLRTFGFLLKDATRLYVQRFEQRARRFGVTLPQCKALGYLSKNEGSARFASPNWRKPTQ